MDIYISGLHSGPNPSPGVGTARSLRLAYPDARLIGVDYSNRSSGIHWTDFDDIWIQRRWNEMDLEAYAQQIGAILESGGMWLSGLDLEGLWLARTIGEHPNLLGPSIEAFASVAKPTIPASADLGVKVPPYMLGQEPDWDLYAFCRKHRWNVWVKGPYNEAYRAGNWHAVRAHRAGLADAWSTDRAFVQAHMPGDEESIIFAAYQGTLLGCARMTKRDVTLDGKAWAGRVTELDEPLATRLRDTVRRINWNGGGELDLIRDPGGEYWVLDWNPRFPAWVHGATVAGLNLPAKLVARERSGNSNGHAPVNAEFTRVVLEIPTRAGFPLSQPLEQFSGIKRANYKHPSGMTELADHLAELQPTVVEERSDNGNHRKHEPEIPDSVRRDLTGVSVHEILTPGAIFLEETARAGFQQAARIQQQCSSPEISVSVAYSIKTNPDDRLLGFALEHGLLAEAISQYEVNKALNVGFRPEQVVLNGPAKWWPEIPLAGRLHSIYCDSIEELRSLIDRDMASTAQRFGVRLRPPKVKSRFGIPIDSFDVFRDVTSLLKRLPEDVRFGVHFHMASSMVGVDEWWDLLDTVLEWAQAIQRVTGKSVECLDLGGGWFPDDLFNHLEPRMMGTVAQASRALPQLRELVIEPGKALAQPSMAVAVRVLEVRGTCEEIEDVVVDGSIAELSETVNFPHRVLWCDANTGNWKAASGGEARVLGRLCMEHDILAADILVPSSVQPGDIAIICDAGAYDRSMSYVFGKG